MRKFRISQISFLDGFALGAFCATELFLIVFMVIDLRLVDEDWIGFVGNMVVAGLSILAAYIALRGNRLQLQQANDIEDERGRKSLAAARAVLPAILSQLSSVATNNIKLRFKSDEDDVMSDETDTQDRAPLAFMHLPENIVPGLKECIQHADDISQDRLANILRHFQVQQAREFDAGIGVIEAYAEKLTMKQHKAISDAIGWAVVHRLISEAFSYSRGTAEFIPPKIRPDGVRTAFSQAGIVLEMYPLLQDILEKRIQSGRLERDWDDAERSTQVHIEVNVQQG